MFETAISLAFGLLSLSLGGPKQQGPMTLSVPLVAPTYQCDTGAWQVGPVVQNNYFYGKLVRTCRVKGISGGGIPLLKADLPGLVTKAAHTVYSTGPTNYLGMEGNVYDLLRYESQGGVALWLRGNTHVVSDGTSRVVNHFFSTSVQGSGNAAYIRRIDGGYDVKATEDPEWYTMELFTYNIVEKPWLIGSGAFQQKVLENLYPVFNSMTVQLVTEVANHTL